METVSIRRNKFYHYSIILFRVVHNHSKLSGSINVTFNKAKYKVETSKRLHWYGIFIHVLLLSCFSVVFIATAITGTFDWNETFENNQVLLVTYSVNGVFIIAALILNFTFNHIFLDTFLDIGNALVSMNFEFFEDPSASTQKKLFLECLTKYFLEIVFMIFHSMFFFSNDVSKLRFFRFIFSFLAFNILETSVSLIYFVIVVITKFYRVLNGKLNEVFIDIILGKTSTYTIKRIKKLSDLYSKVYDVHRFSFQLFKFGILVFLATTYINNISMAFNVYSLASSPKFYQLEFWSLLVATVLTFVDLFVVFLACEDNVQTSLVARTMLRGFYGKADVETERMVRIVVYLLIS